MVQPDRARPPLLRDTFHHARLCWSMDRIRLGKDGYRRRLAVVKWGCVSESERFSRRKESARRRV